MGIKISQYSVSDTVMYGILQRSDEVRTLNKRSKWRPIHHTYNMEEEMSFAENDV